MTDLQAETTPRTDDADVLSPDQLTAAVHSIADRSRVASRTLGRANRARKDRVLLAVADALVARRDTVLAATEGNLGSVIRLDLSVAGDDVTDEDGFRALVPDGVEYRAFGMGCSPCCWPTCSSFGGRGSGRRRSRDGWPSFTACWRARRRWNCCCPRRG